jgi:hypothetical protein
MRVNVETRALAERRLEILMKKMRWRKREALGLLVLLWHDSQEQKQSEAGKIQILDWLDSRNGSEAEKIFSALVESKYLVHDPVTDFYEIRGNKRHVEAYKAMEEGRKKAAEVTNDLKKNKKLLSLVPAKSDAPSEVEAAVGPSSNAMQSNAYQSNAEQSVSKQCVTEQSKIDLSPQEPELLVLPELLNCSERSNRFFAAITKDTQKVWLRTYKDPEWIRNELKNALDWLEQQSDQDIQHFGRWFASWLKKAKAKQQPPQFNLVSPEVAQCNTEANRATWNAYLQAHVSRWKVEPTRNAKVNAMVSQFVKRVGADDAPEVIKFFVNHNDGLYVKSTHSLTLAVRDAEALRTQWLRGKAITSNDVRTFERQSGFQDQLEKIQRGEI